MTSEPVYIAPYRNSFKVCCGNRVLCTCDRYIDAWRLRASFRRGL